MQHHPANRFRRDKCDRKPRLPALLPVAHAALCACFGLAPLAASALDAGALPTNGQIVAGSGTVSTSGTTMTVTQSTDRMVANWDTFNIGSAATVNFVQPTSSSVALNRVLSSDASQIMGALNANGQVYLVNPNGVLFGAGSSVSVGGLVASALDISDANFMAGRNIFELGSGTGAVINLGNITATDGGYVALLGAQVRNEGTIAARLGSVVLGAGEKITLDFNGDGLINMEVADTTLGSTLNASVTNSGLLQAGGGTVLMTAHAGNALMAEVVNNSGIIEATSLQQRNGVVVLDGGSSGVVANSGTINVSGRNAGETGGTVKLLGEYVGMFDGSRIDASGDAGGGTVLAGGDYQGGNGVFQATATYMDANASIDASARTEGNGGKVILWSEDSTRFYGDISVAGAGTGAGGLVETSGHYLDVYGMVNLSAASGQGGTWLLDPYNINITSAANAVNTTSSSPFTSSGSTSSNLSSATLNASLSEGANILVCTTSVGGTSGDINVLDNVKAVGNATLTLQAHRNIVMTNTSITNADGKSLNVSLYSNYNNTGNGSVALTNATIATGGGNLTISGAVSPTSSYASTNVSNGTGVMITTGTNITTSGGNIVIRGATSSSLASASTANATVISGGSTIDAGGGNISITALQASTSGTGEAFVLTGGSRIVTNGTGSISIDSTNLGSGNGTRIYSTNNTIAATGSGNVNISGNATSGYGVLVCATAAASSQNISVGSGTLTISGNSNGFAGSGRGVYIAAAGDGIIKLAASAGGNIVIGGSSTGSYGAILASTGTTSAINVLTDGDISIAGNTSGTITTPALALSASNGTSTGGAQITVRSTSGNVTLTGNNTVVNTSTSAFRGLFLDASGQSSNISIGTNSGRLTLNGSSVSGRGVDIAPSGANASINLSTTTGDIAINGNSTTSYGGYGILFNSSNGAVGINVSTTTGNITLTGDSVGTSDAIALSGNGTASANRITSQGGNITLNGYFHSPTVTEVDHGIAILAVTNVISTTGSGNITLNGTSTELGSAVAFYSSGVATFSVENGTLAVNGNGNTGDGIAFQTGVNTLKATGSGSIVLTGSSAGGSGISFYPSGNASSATITTAGGDISLTGVSGAASSAAGILIRSASTAANGVSIVSAGGDINLSGTGNGSGEGISFVGTSSNGYNTVATTGGGNLNITAVSNGAYGLRFTGGNNTLLVQNGILSITARAPNGAPLGQSGDTTVISATGNGVVVRNLGGFTSNLLTNPLTAPATVAVQSNQVNNGWFTAPPATMRMTPIGGEADRINLDLALLSAAPAAGAPSRSNVSTETQDNERN